MLDGISELQGNLELHPGGHNWPDMQIVVDPSQTDVASGNIYLVSLRGTDPVVKLLEDTGSCFKVKPALASIHGHSSATLFGRTVPVTKIEFTDSYYKHAVRVVGKVVGIWAGALPVNDGQIGGAK